MKRCCKTFTFSKNVRTRFFCAFILGLLGPFCNLVLANEDGSVDKHIQSILKDPEQLHAGEKLFQGVCAACHAKNLKGAMGFNLIDGEWVHGERPAEIVNSIKNGFSKAGMPGFSGALSEVQIQQLTAFILSKREGWLNVNYAIYKPTDSVEQDFAQINQVQPTKWGKGENNLADFALPEVKDYVLNFEGDFHAPWQEPTSLWFDVPPMVRLKVFIDGEEVSKPNEKAAAFPLKPGKQHLRISYSTKDTPFWVHKNLNAMVASRDLTVKLAGVSARGHASILRKEYVLSSEQTTQVIRRKTVKLPASSVVVGLTNKFSYAFNTKSCAIVAAWKGDFLNIGPNIDGRGRDGSIPLGNIGFSAPQSIHLADNTQSCRMTKYTRKSQPVFYFTQGENAFSLQGKAVDNGIEFTYSALSKGAFSDKTQWILPATGDYLFSSPDGTLANNTLSLQNPEQDQVSLLLKAK